MYAIRSYYDSDDITAISYDDLFQKPSESGDDDSTSSSNTDSVITSYSIHYTKLYEGRYC